MYTKWKRILAALLAAAAVSAFLAACGANDAGGTSSPESSSSVRENEKEEKSAASGGSQKEDDREEERGSREESADSSAQSPPQEKETTQEKGSSSVAESAAASVSSGEAPSSSSSPAENSRINVKTEFGRTYQNDELGLTIQFPQEWEHNYSALVKKDAKIASKYRGQRIDFCYKDEEAALIAVVTVLTTEDYAEAGGSLTGYGSELGKNSKYVFWGTTVKDSPYGSDTPDGKLYDQLYFAGNKLVGMTAVAEPQASSSSAAAGKSSLSQAEQQSYYSKYVEPLDGAAGQSWSKAADINPTTLMKFALSRAIADGKDPEKENAEYIPRGELERYIEQYFHTDGTELRRFGGYSEEEKGYKNEMAFGGGPAGGFRDLNAVQKNGVLTITYGQCPWDDAKSDWGDVAANVTLTLHVEGDQFYYISNKVEPVA